MKVFLSHASQDEKFAKKLASDLRAADCDVLTYFEAISFGESIAEKVASAILGSDVLLSLLSKESAKSSWMNSEIVLARSRIERNACRRILPIIIQRDAEIPFFIKDLLYIDMSDENKYRENLPRLIQSLKETKIKMLPADKMKGLRAREEMVKAQETVMRIEERFYRRHKMIQHSFISQIVRMGFLIALFLGLTASVLIVYSKLQWNFILGGVLIFFGGMSVPIFVFLLYQRFEFEQFIRLRNNLQNVFERVNEQERGRNEQR